MTCDPRAAVVIACLAIANSAAFAAEGPIDAGAAPDGGTTLDDGGPAQTAFAQPSPAPVDSPAADVLALRALLEGRRADERAVFGAFDLELLEGEALAQRRASLRRRVAAALADAGGPLDDVVALAHERDRLLLAFLEKPASERAVLWEVQRRHRLLRSEQDGARTAKESAEEAVKQALLAQESALDAARVAGSERARAVAAERARLEGARQQLAALSARLAGEREADVEADRLREADVESLLTGRPRSPAETDALYDALVVQLVASRDLLRQALAALSEPSPVQRLAATLDMRAVAVEAAEDERALQAAYAEYAAEAAVLEGEIMRRRQVTAAARAANVARLNTARIELIDRLSPQKRARVLGFTREGFEQLGREIEHVRLMATWYLAGHRGELARLGTTLGDGLTLGLAGVRVLKVVFVVAVLVFVRHRLPGWLVALRAAVSRRTTNTTVRVWAARWIAAAGAIAGQLAFMLVQMDFFIDPTEDVRTAKDVVLEAITTTQYATLSRPFTVVVSQELLRNRSYIRLRAKVYVLDVLYEKALSTDVTERVVAGLQESGVAPFGRGASAAAAPRAAA